MEKTSAKGKVTKGMNTKLIVGGILIVLVVVGLLGYFAMQSGDEEEMPSEPVPPPMEQPQPEPEMEEAPDTEIIPADEEEIGFVINAEPKGRCGPRHNDARCIGKEFCNKSGYCGESDQYKYPTYSKYSGPSSSFHDSTSPYSKKCGPDNNGEKCRFADTCNEEGDCGEGGDFNYSSYSQFAGPDSIYSPNVVPTEVADFGGRCGPTHNKRCPGTQTCSKTMYCGDDESIYKYDKYSTYGGPKSTYYDVISPYSKKCGPDNDEQVCRGQDICSENGECVKFTTEDAMYGSFSDFAGPESCFKKQSGCIPPANAAERRKR
jgi:hypothetical protein